MSAIPETPFTPRIDDGLEIPPRPLDAPIAGFEQRWKASGVPGLYEGTGPEMRERGRCVRGFLYPKPDLPHGAIEPLTIPGPRGDIPCRVIWPKDAQADGRRARATLVYFHGGGFILGDLDSHEMHAVRIANATGAVVVNVGYRLAPEDPYPAGIDDAWAALQCVAARRAEFGGATAPLAVGGDSAGGNFAAVTAVQARDAGITLAAQLLLYPATDMAGDGHGRVRTLYLGPDEVRIAREPRVSPLYTPTLAGVAPAILAVGVHDFLYRDNLAYARALRAAGVPLHWQVFDNLNHGFFSYTAVSGPSAVAAEQVCAVLARLLD